MNTKQALLFVTALTILASLARADDWPGFRGLGRQGVSPETGLPLKWSNRENVAWKTEIPGESWSSPIVWQDRIFITTATERGASCHVICLESKTGKILWDKEVLRQMLKRKENRNTYATSTPCTDGERVYAAFGAGSLVALDMNGQIVWTNQDFPYYSQHGMAVSPIIWEDLLIIPHDHSAETGNLRVGWQIPWDQSFVLALERKTGKVRWKASRGTSRIGHVTPAVWAPPNEKVQLISGAGDVVQGFDIKTGQLLWTSKNIGEAVVPSIVLGDGLAFTGSGYGGRESIKAFRLDAKGDAGETNLAWEERTGASKVPSYLYLKPYLYVVNDAGQAMCMNGATGQILWKERLGGTYSASPVAADGHIYFLSDKGETIVIDPGPKFNILARNPLGEQVQASMAVAGQHLFIRTADNLYCVGR